ncbi:hypothetical protein ACLB2K_038383 [Fragaria x ananassa]
MQMTEVGHVSHRNRQHAGEVVVVEVENTEVSEVGELRRERAVEDVVGESIVSLLSVEHVKRTVPFSVEPSFPDAVDASNDWFILIGSRGEGARWLSGSNQKASSSIRRLRRWAGDVEVESEEAEVEAELEVVVDGIRRSRGVNVKLAASRSRRHRWPAASRSRSRRRHRRRSSRSAPSYHR